MYTKVNCLLRSLMLVSSAISSMPASISPSSTSTSSSFNGTLSYFARSLTGIKDRVRLWKPNIMVLNKQFAKDCDGQFDMICDRGARVHDRRDPFTMYKGLWWSLWTNAYAVSD